MTNRNRLVDIIKTFVNGSVVWFKPDWPDKTKHNGTDPGTTSCQPAWRGPEAGQPDPWQLVVLFELIDGVHGWVSSSFGVCKE